MIIRPMPATSDALRAAVQKNYHADEAAVVRMLLDRASQPEDRQTRIQETAATLVKEVRKSDVGKGGIDAFLHEYELSSTEGIVLMCLAEALLRIPDADTADALIKDKLGDANWQSHLGHSDSLFVNASTWALMLTGKVVSYSDDVTPELGSVLGRAVARVGEPVIRGAMYQAMRIMGRQFVLGRNIGEALKEAKDGEKQGYRYSFDMLGEGARTMTDADRYYAAYVKAIDAIGKDSKGKSVAESNGISVKLSAIHPRYLFSHQDACQPLLVDRITALAEQAAGHGMGLTIDAEEADRLEPSMDILAEVAAKKSIKGWNGLGLAVQAYQKRALPLLDWLDDLGKTTGRQFMVRLVKGAYWDTEVKRAQEQGLKGYPVFTRKSSTDVSYLACAQRLFDSPGSFYPQFATHNAHTVAAVLELAGNSTDWEFQRLHGMGEALYEQVVGKSKLDRPCRVYAPVGIHEDLLAYLVRRLLENGANTSFVNRIVDAELPVESIIEDPIARTKSYASLPHPQIAQPGAIFQPERKNSMGIDLSDVEELRPLAADMEKYAGKGWAGGPLIAGKAMGGKRFEATNPFDRRQMVGTVTWSSEADVDAALDAAVPAARRWDETPAGDRASAIERYADLLEENIAEAMAVCVREAGKSIEDSLGEVREAVDFCRYYAARCREEFGPESGENQLSNRGVFVCISPWNFPLAIFTGQVTAALAAGNAVLAKPAEQTSLVAHFAVSLMHKAGVPEDVIQLLPGDGVTVGARLVADKRIGGVAFTGSTETARRINKTLAGKDGPIVPFIAETGGQNALIVDSSALPEQVVDDVIMSSFNSAGQRCSACRVLYVQEDIADRLTKMLVGAMEELHIGDPSLISTDVGPVIDETAKKGLDAHAARMTKEAKLLHECPLPEAASNGTFVAPRAFEVPSLEVIGREQFGPILHVIRYKASKIEAVLDAINDSGYGLTFGVHTRIDENVARWHARARVGNTYVNRNIIGAVVGVQPFGGQGLSGTGPKAGGPRYLHRFAAEGQAGAGIALPDAGKLRPDEAALQKLAGKTDGDVRWASESDVDAALDAALPAAQRWDMTPAETRANAIARYADLLEENIDEVIALCVRETGMSIEDTLGEVQEAVGHSRYYAARCRAEFGAPQVMPGPTGESNTLRLANRGAFVCLSGRSSPLAGFTGQIMAALAAGNTVLAKPSKQAPLIADFAVSLMHKAGVPKDVVQVLPGDGETIGARLVADTRIGGVAFNGAPETAQRINRALAEKDSAIVPLITEPGGPRYLQRFATERVLTINTTATGGNAALLSLEDEA